ncbi:hypothetical protein K457DRAFT_138307 [Linnemannia elongata AG-77]|uniref:F-box domain-containing protein n=1 Tax=Linnemannia elongata AG-77 TaxID=1314771 RepID=A0A197JUY3_9FUNG|nr:hypothetical protein K457DRAFT_138307 [Linnemannia elongata AG-77]
MDQQTSQSNKTPVLLQECIQLVLSYLQFNQLPTLCSLLRVNKTLFQLTTPILYLNPFLIVRSRGTWSEDEKAERLEHLLRLFISELDPTLRAQLPPLAYTDEDDEQEDWTSNTAIDTLQSAAAIPEISRGYFYHYRRIDHSFLASRAIPKVFATFSRTQSQAVLAQLDRVFLRHCGERALSICMATPRVRSFMGMIPRLKCLRRIELHRMECVTDENLQEMVDWIKTHNETHGTLRELQMGGHSEYDNRCYDGDDPNSHLSNLRRYKASEFDDDDTNSRRDLVLLPQAYRTLTELDTRSWSGAWPTIDQVPVEDLFRLVMDYGEGVAPDKGCSFMLRCKGLKVLDLYVPAEDTFRDVAYLFKSRFHPDSLSDVDKSATAAAGAIASTSTTTSPLNPVRNALTDGTAVLPPVEKLYISGHHNNLRNALENAPVGLSQTLRILKVTSMERHTVEKPSITWGYPLLQVEMPFLVDLQLQGDIALEFHFGVLRSCPNLISFKLMVNGFFSCDQPGNPLEPILSLQKLQCLQLLGKWALTREFVKGLGTRSTALKMLDLARCYGVELEEVLEAVEGLKFLWRVGWDMEEVDGAEELVARWRTRMPHVTVGFIQANEFYA